MVQGMEQTERAEGEEVDEGKEEVHRSTLTLKSNQTMIRKPDK